MRRAADTVESGPPSPTDLELMLWVDGELPPERAAEVAAFLEKNQRARAVVASLRLGGEVIASHALGRAESLDPNDMTEIVLDDVEAAASRRFMAPKRKPPAWRMPAVAAIGMAFAVAAAFVLVLRSTDRTRLPIPDGTGAVSMMPAGVEEDIGSSRASIAVVDFGARSGAVFYVPADGDGTLAVVWLSDDDDSNSGEMQ